MPKANKTIPQLAEDVAKLLQKYVRLAESDDNGYGKCVSCGQSFHWKDRQGGHFIERGKLSTKLDRRNVNSQCYGCNGFGKYHMEKQAKYVMYIEKTYGKGTVDDLIKISHTTRKYTRDELELLKDELNAKIKAELERIS